MRATMNAYVAQLKVDEDVEFRDWNVEMTTKDYLIQRHKQKEIEFFKLKDTMPW